VQPDKGMQQVKVSAGNLCVTWLQLCHLATFVSPGYLWTGGVRDTSTSTWWPLAGTATWCCHLVLSPPYY